MPIRELEAFSILTRGHPTVIRILSVLPLFPKLRASPQRRDILPNNTSSYQSHDYRHEGRGAEVTAQREADDDNAHNRTEE